MVSVLILGIYCEDIHTDSSFSHTAGNVSTVYLCTAGNLADIHIYCGKGSQRLIEEFILSRQTARTAVVIRLSQCLITALLMTGAYLLSLFFQNAALCIAGYDNQYNRRTLDYIHHNDGKKSHIFFN